MKDEKIKILILGAHPDDAEYHAGGLSARFSGRGDTVKLVSVSNGAAGHHERSPESLIPLRKEEAARAGSVIGSTYEVWEFPDGELFPALELRQKIIREIRTFAPDLLLTHRTCDYHPDHRAVGQAVQDACYLITVPNVLPNVPALKKDPVVFFLPDLFTRPYPLRADILLDVTDEADQIIRMLACHASQVFEWLPYEEGILDQVPADEKERLGWLHGWFKNHALPRADRFRDELVQTFGTERGKKE